MELYFITLAIAFIIVIYFKIRIKIWRIKRLKNEAKISEYIRQEMEQEQGRNEEEKN